MKLFIRRFLCFAIVALTILCSLSFINYLIIKSAPLAISKNKQILILGDSNSQCAVDDGIFKQGVNLSASADSYFYSYLKLKKILNSNTGVDTLLLAFAPHNIGDNGWLTSDAHINSRFMNYYPLMDKSDFLFLWSKNPSGVFYSFWRITRASISTVTKKVTGKKILPKLGGFLKLKRNILSEVQTKLKNGEPLPFFDIQNNFAVSPDEVIYLNKIISTCRENKIKLYFINTPKRHELLDFPSYGVTEFYKFYDENYQDIEFLDFSKLKLPDDNYGDFVHLNAKGSTNFSSILKTEGLNNLIKGYERNQTGKEVR